MLLLDPEAYRRSAHRWIDELDDVAVHVGRPHQRMGTRAVPEDAWLDLDEHAGEEMAERRRLFDERPDEVHAALPGAEAAAAEALELVTAWLARCAPDHPVIPADGLPPLAAAGLAAQDDLCVMQEVEGAWVLTAALLCAPTYWRLHDKLGLPLARIHDPVPHYAEDLEARVDRFFSRFPADRIVGRRNWGFSTHRLLFVPDRSVPDTPGQDGPDGMWLRSERQTLRRLPASRAILFGIRVQHAPIDALADHPAVARRLAAAMAAWSPELAASRGRARPWVPGTVTLLEHLAAGP